MAEGLPIIRDHESEAEFAAPDTILATTEEARKFAEAFYDEPGKPSKRHKRAEAAVACLEELDLIDKLPNETQKQFAQRAIRSYFMIEGIAQRVGSGEGYLTKTDYTLYYKPLFPNTEVTGEDNA